MIIGQKSDKTMKQKYVIMQMVTCKESDDSKVTYIKTYQKDDEGVKFTTCERRKDAMQFNHCDCVSAMNALNKLPIPSSERCQYFSFYA